MSLQKRKHRDLANISEKMLEMVAVKGVGRMLGFVTYVVLLIGTVYRRSILFFS